MDRLQLQTSQRFIDCVKGCGENPGGNIMTQGFADYLFFNGGKNPAETQFIIVGEDVEWMDRLQLHTSQGFNDCVKG